MSVQWCTYQLPVTVFLQAQANFFMKFDRLPEDKRPPGASVQTIGDPVYYTGMHVISIQNHKKL